MPTITRTNRSLLRGLMLLSILAVSLVAKGWTQSSAAIVHGTVDGPRGSISGAEVLLLREDTVVLAIFTDSTGAFQFADFPPGSYELQVSAPPYVPIRRHFELDADTQVLELSITLQHMHEEITVTATRLPVPTSSAVADVKILSADDLREMPYQSIDDGLRLFPEFSLFRRSSSLVSHPTSQGVSLRGIGPSGVSRSLVLADGIPLNDAFGGWVYWNRIPLLSLQQVEIANGGGSSLYGNYGLGGVLQFIRRIPQPATVDFLGQIGNNTSLKGDVYASHRIGPWGFSVAGSFFDFDGYPTVVEEQRGTADIAAFSRHQAVRFQTEWAPENRSTIFFFEGGLLNEVRGNGTRIQNNDTDSFDFSTGLMFNLGPRDRIEARAFFRRNIFVSDFSAVADDRDSERQVVHQHVPAADGGFSLLWFRNTARTSYATGFDTWIVRGQSTDSVFFGPRIGLIRQGGGRTSTSGFFGEVNYSLSYRTSISLGSRLDFWKRYDGFRGSFSPDSPSVDSIEDRTEVEFSPRLGLSHSPIEPLTLHASVFRSFRAPTLNEMYRPFRVGNVNTTANTDLDPEHNTGAEIGARVRLQDRFAAGLSWFINSLNDPVSNVTVDTTPALITRQRQNLGRVRVTGLQASLNLRPVSQVEFDFAYLWNRSRVTEAPAVPGIVDNLLAQVPEHRATGTLSVSLPQRFRAVLTGRFVGEQFDDDRNEIVLPEFLSWDLNLSRSLGEAARAFVAFENLTDTEIIVNRSPVDRLGAPFQIRGGIYFRLSGDR